METDTTALVIADNRDLALARAPAVVLAEAQLAARALGEVIAAKPRKVMFNNEQYLEFEDWQTVARFYGMTAKEDGDPELVDIGGVQGFKASAVVIDRDGVERSRATAYCLNDEDKWSSRPKYAWCYVTKSGERTENDPGPDQIIWEPNPDKPGKNRPKKERVLIGEEKVPLFQLASMAQTRACAKALKNVLSWVVVLAGYKPTPAEEIDGQPGATTVETSGTPQQGPQRTSARAQAASAATGVPAGTQTQQQTGGVISEPQQRRLFARARAAGHSDDDVHGYLKSRWGLASAKDMKRANYDEIVARVDNTAKLGELEEDIPFADDIDAQQAAADGA